MTTRRHRRLVRSAAFRRDLKRCAKRGKDLTRLARLLELLLAGEPLPQQYKDHPLKGAWQGYRDAHIEPDWLLLYRVAGEDVHLTRTGSHTDLFE